MGSALMYGASPWPEFEEFARGLLAERDRLGRLVANAIAGLAAAASHQGRQRSRPAVRSARGGALRARRRIRQPHQQSEPRVRALSSPGISRVRSGSTARGGTPSARSASAASARPTGRCWRTCCMDLGRRSEAEAILAEVEAIAPRTTGSRLRGLPWCRRGSQPPTAAMTRRSPLRNAQSRSGTMRTFFSVRGGSTGARASARSGGPRRRGARGARGGDPAAHASRGRRRSRPKRARYCPDGRATSGST